MLDLLRPDFPDVTISKIRFLEAEGLVTPQRSPRLPPVHRLRLCTIAVRADRPARPLFAAEGHQAKLDDAEPDGELPRYESRHESPYLTPRLVPVVTFPPTAPRPC